MRVLMLSWEYPPRIVGGIARHVEEIAWALAGHGEDVHVVTCDFPGAPAEETYCGVQIHRVKPHQPVDNFFHWVHQLNAAMYDRARSILTEWTSASGARTGSDAVILHAHDWLAKFCAVDLKHEFRLPLVVTIHATEFGRNNGVHTPDQRYISSVEWDLTYEAWRVIVCSGFMRGEIQYSLGTPGDKIDVIPNGVHAEKFGFAFPPDEAAEFRSRFAAPDEKLVFFVGRMVREKGANILIDAFSKVRAQYGAAKLVIVGGGYRDHLMRQAWDFGIWDKVYFTGFMPDGDLLKLYRVIDVACFPSLYEPFGIVALEAMAAGVPVVVSDAGGLPEVVEHDVTGLVTWLGNPESLAWGILRVLRDPDHAQWMAQNARRRVLEDFNWDGIAHQTRAVYQRVWQEYHASGWGG